MVDLYFRWEALSKQWSGVTPLQGHLHLNGQCPDPEAEREALGGGEYARSREVVELWGLDRGGGSVPCG